MYLLRTMLAAALAMTVPFGLHAVDPPPVAPVVPAGYQWSTGSVPLWARDGAFFISGLTASYTDMALFSVKWTKSPLGGYESGILDPLGRVGTTDALSALSYWNQVRQTWSLLIADSSIVVPSVLQDEFTQINNELNAGGNGAVPETAAILSGRIARFVGDWNGMGDGSDQLSDTIRLVRIYLANNTGAVNWARVSEPFSKLATLTVMPNPEASGSVGNVYTALVNEIHLQVVQGATELRNGLDLALSINAFLDSLEVSTGTMPPRAFHVAFTIGIRKPGGAWQLSDQGVTQITRAYSLGWQDAQGVRRGYQSSSLWFGDERRKLGDVELPLGTEIMIIADPRGEFGGRDQASLDRRTLMGRIERERNLWWGRDNQRGIFVRGQEESVVEQKEEDIVIPAANESGISVPWASRNTVLVFSYLDGTWTNGQYNGSPDAIPLSDRDAMRKARVAICDQDGNVLSVVPIGSARTPYQFVVPGSVEFIRLKISDTAEAFADNEGQVTYRVAKRRMARALEAEGYKDQYRFDPRILAWTKAITGLPQGEHFLRKFDVNKDGWIDQEEFATYELARSIGDVLRTINVLSISEKLLSEQDRDHDGLISQSEYLAWLPNISEQPAPVQVDTWLDSNYYATGQNRTEEVHIAARQFFGLFDANGDGEINETEYQSFRNAMNDGSLAKRLRDASQGLLDNPDLNGNGIPDAEEVAAAEGRRFNDLVARQGAAVALAFDRDRNQRLSQSEYDFYLTSVDDGTIYHTRELRDEPGVIFSRYDVNGDGLITPIEYGNYQSTKSVLGEVNALGANWLFALFDTNGDGVISGIPSGASEMDAFNAASRAGYVRGSDQVKDTDPTRYTYYDANKTGIIESWEMRVFTQTQELATFDPYIRNLFSDANGLVQDVNYESYLAQQANISTTVQVYHDPTTNALRFQRYDVNGDGMISATERVTYDQTSVALAAANAQLVLGRPGLFEYYDVDGNSVLDLAEYERFTNDRTTGSGRFAVFGVSGDPSLP